MNDIVSGLMDLYGIDTVPTDFPSFMVWLCSLIAALMFSRLVVGTILSLYNKSMGVGRK